MTIFRQLLLLTSTEVLLNINCPLILQLVILASLVSQKFLLPLFCLTCYHWILLRQLHGPDGLPARFLKEVSNEIVKPLTVLYNESLQTGIIPLEWKRSHITPVHKGGPADDATNYRPIAVVSVVVKILEKLVATELSRYLESTAQLHPHQTAYRLGKSTEDILRVAVDIISNSIDS